MTYEVTISSTDGKKHTYSCGGASDQEALVYAGKIVEENADRSDPDAAVSVTKDGQAIGPKSIVRDMIKRAV